MFVFIALVSIDILVPESGTFSDIASSEAMAPAVEKALEEAEAPIGALAPDGIQSNRAALSEEAAPLAPVIKEAVEEIIEVESEDAVSESEDLAQSDTGLDLKNRLQSGKGKLNSWRQPRLNRVKGIAPSIRPV